MVVRPLFRSFPQNQFQFMPKPIDAVGPIILSEMLNNFSKYECVDLGIGFSGSMIRHDRSFGASSFSGRIEYPSKFVH